MNTPVENSSLESSLDDIRFLTRSEHRVGMLNTLSVQPCDRTDLRAVTGASAPTVGRILADFKERRWIVRDGRTYELTRLGEFVTEHLMVLCEAMATERKLRDVWQWLPVEMPGFTVELFADAVVAFPGSGYPYEPVERITQILKETKTMRGFGTSVFKSGNLDVFYRCLLDGMEVEYIYSPPILETVVAWDPRKAAKAMECENCTILLHDSLPDRNRCGIGIYDERTGICCHDHNTKLLQAVIDTKAPEAREWAESVYERYRRDARPFDLDQFMASTDVSV